jgi:hypothetical protein
MKREGASRSIVSFICLALIPVMIAVTTGCATVSSLGRAAKRGDIQAVEDMLNKGADVNAVVTPGLSPLHEAVFNNARLDIVRLMLERGADVNKISCGDGWAANCNCASPLYIAACKGNVNMVKLLLERGADVSITSHDKKTPLAIAQGNGQTAIVRLLKQAEEKQYKELIANDDAPRSSGEKRTALPVSDVDELPAVKAKQNSKAYAVVIGIQNYRQKLPKADYAAQDAKLVADYLAKALGYPEENIITLLNENATNVDLVKYLERWLPNNVEKGSSVFVYYSGHGAPDSKTGGAYLVPYDGDPTFIAETGYSLKRLYDTLGKLPAKEIIVALDSCFSGAGGRSVLAKGARPLVINLQNNLLPSKNMTVMAASSGNQISSTYEEKGHGLFTYFMLKGIKSEDVMGTDGSLKIDDLFSYLKPQVERIARKQYNNEQTPQLIQALDQGK